jgi:hypothetical protein
MPIARRPMHDEDKESVPMVLEGVKSASEVETGGNQIAERQYRGMTTSYMLHDAKVN